MVTGNINYPPEFVELCEQGWPDDDLLQGMLKRGLDVRVWMETTYNGMNFYPEDVIVYLEDGKADELMAEAKQRILQIQAHAMYDDAGRARKWIQKSLEDSLREAREAGRKARLEK